MANDIRLAKQGISGQKWPEMSDDPIAKSGEIKGTYSAFQRQVIELLTKMSPYGNKHSDVVTFIVTRELDKIFEENRFGVRDAMNKKAGSD